MRQYRIQRQSDLVADAIAWLVLVAGLAALVWGLSWPPTANAALAPLESDSYTVVCATTATEISAPSNAQFSYMCQNSSTTAVFVGDNDLTTTTAPQFCATNCQSQEWGGNVAKEFCRVASGTVTIKCRSQVIAAP